MADLRYWLGGQSFDPQGFHFGRVDPSHVGARARLAAQLDGLAERLRSEPGPRLCEPPGADEVRRRLLEHVRGR